MFETLTLTTLLITLYFFYMNTKLGLTSSVPKNPENRMKFFCSECLTTLKQLLAGAKVRQLDGQSLSFESAANPELSRLACREGRVVLQTADQPPRTLHTLGSRGRLTFEQVSERGLLVDIEAADGDASHRVSVRLEAVFC